MAKGTKKQHFVPQLLLRQFADRDEHLFVYNMAADRSHGSSVRDAGHQNHFLSVPTLDGEDGPGAHYERLFQGYEGPAMTAISEIQAGLTAGVMKVIGDSQRQALSRFIAVQYVRTPAAREQAFQLVELMRRVLATEIAKRNDFDTTDPKIAEAIERFTAIPSEEEAALHGEQMLQPEYIEDIAKVLAGHVWLVGINRTDKPLYVADHPVALHGHVDRPGRGIGPASYGAEVILPLSSTIQLSLLERKFVLRETDALERLDGGVYSQLNGDNVLFQRAKQVFAAQQFVYCERDDFHDARRICSEHPELRDPRRPRVEAVAFGKVGHPRRRKPDLLQRSWRRD